MIKKRIIISLTVMLMLTLGSCTKKDKNEVLTNSIVNKGMVSSDTVGTVETKTDSDKTALKVTFIELGSVNCAPCRMMTPVMDKVKENFPAQVDVVFYDVWTPQDAPMAQKYKIRVIPTQVFLDGDGIEYFRHEGFFSYDELAKILQMKGVR